MAKTKRKLHIAMVVDTWFPVNGLRLGKYGGTQVHVKELRWYLNHRFRSQANVFYGSRDNILYKLLWPIIVCVDLILYNRYHKLDLIHSHGLASALGSKIAASVLRIPHVHTIHQSPHMDQKKRSLFKPLESFILTKIRYDAQLILSSHFKQYPNINHRLIEIDNGVDLHAFSQVRVKKNKTPTLIWVGSPDRSKGVPILKQAILKVRKKIPNLQAVLISNGELDRIDLIKAYKRSHVFVLSSLSEGQPISLFEAWAAKLPVVVTNVGEVGRLVKDGENGYVVEPGNAKQLAQAILKVLRGKKKPTQMLKAGYQMVKVNYSWLNTAKQIYQVYKEVLVPNQTKKIKKPSKILKTSFLRRASPKLAQ